MRLNRKAFIPTPMAYTLINSRTTPNGTQSSAVRRTALLISMYASSRIFWLRSMLSSASTSRAKKVLGIHMRGTDKGSAKLSPELMRIIKPREYFPYIDEYIHKHSNCKIFVATEQQQFLRQMTSRYGERILSYEAIRTTGLRNPFHLHGSGYRKGEEVLIDCLLLSRSDYLLKCTSAVGEFAMYFNPNLACVDLNHMTNGINYFQFLVVQLRHRAWQRYLRLKRGKR